MPKKVWVLTSEYNDYDQHGEYFEAVFNKRPDVKQLSNYFKLKKEDNGFSDAMEALDFLLHVESGGGRQGVEGHWYNLNEVECM